MENGLYYRQNILMLQNLPVCLDFSVELESHMCCTTDKISFCHMHI